MNAREALIRVLDAEADLDPTSEPGGAALKLPDRLLAALWVEGFKIVPIEDPLTAPTSGGSILEPL